MTDKRDEGPSLSRGDRLGPYQIIEWVGSGGMADVYRARDPRFERDATWKFLEGLHPVGVSEVAP